MTQDRFAKKKLMSAFPPKADISPCLNSDNPYHIAMEMLMTGRWLDAQEAHQWGFVNEIVSPDRLLIRAREIADHIAAGPPLVMAAIKEIVRDAEDSKFQDTLARITSRSLATVDTLYGSEDMLEGFKAFTEKRPPRMEG